MARLVGLPADASGRTERIKMGSPWTSSFRFATGLGRSAPLPTSITNRFGYDIEFDKAGRFEEYIIDFEALAEHLYQLHGAAKVRGVGIALVILDPPYLAKLFATTRGPFLQQNLKFMKGAAWIRHDEHYHVDFAVPCNSDG